jgi:hypothetical protein
MAYEKGEITEVAMNCFLTKTPENLDELEECYSGLVEALENKRYYQLLARIEKAEVVIEKEPDMRKRDYYIKKMRELVMELENIQLKRGIGA